MGTAVVPWTDSFALDEALFRAEIASLLAANYAHLYVFGTVGEGYAVDDMQFEQIARIFVDEMRSGNAEPMVGVISLSLPTILRLSAASMLRHFVSERGFAYASLFAEPGLLISLATLNLEMGKRYFAAGQARDVATLIQLDGELHTIGQHFLSMVSEGRAPIDGAYDKVLWWLHDQRFPLRLLPPYAGANKAAAQRFLAYLRECYPNWAP
jgi:hypothetical protein